MMAAPPINTTNREDPIYWPQGQAALRVDTLGYTSNFMFRCLLHFRHLSGLG